jgi:hypothetical protein
MWRGRHSVVPQYIVSKQKQSAASISNSEFHMFTLRLFCVLKREPQCFILLLLVIKTQQTGIDEVEKCMSGKVIHEF